MKGFEIPQQKNNIFLRNIEHILIKGFQIPH